MKKIIFLLSFVFVFCVTANTESRDLSAVNTAEDKNIKTAFNWKFWERNTPKPEEDSPEHKHNPKLYNCLNDCYNDPCDKYCETQCQRWYGKTNTKKEGVKVASIGDQNPFNLLKESQNGFEHLSTSQDKNHKDKAPLMLADDYEDCMCDCIANTQSTRGCQEVCE